jgi:hypothetical protein
MVCPPATSEAEARWPRFSIVVIATTSRRDYLDQMIRPLVFRGKTDVMLKIVVLSLRNCNFSILVCSIFVVYKSNFSKSNYKTENSA